MSRGPPPTRCAGDKLALQQSHAKEISSVKQQEEARVQAMEAAKDRALQDKFRKFKAHAGLCFGFRDLAGERKHKDCFGVC